MNVTYKVSLAGLSGEKALAPVSVRAFLRQKCGFSHGLWRRLKWNGTLLVNGEEVRATTAVVRDGDVVTCRIAESSSLAATPMPLDIR